MSKIGDHDYVIALAIEGENLDSVQLAKKIERLQVDGFSTITFIIGGSLGLSKEVMIRSQYSLSFGKMTFPHQLMKLMLTEQIYRAFRIIHNEPYHK